MSSATCRPMSGRGGRRLHKAMGCYYSLNESQTIVYKAARGAGLDWGSAEEAGYAGYWLAARRLSACFSKILTARNRLTAPVESATGNGLLQPPADSLLCPLLAGMYFSDSAFLPRSRWRLQQTAQPLILAPFVARAAAISGRRLRLLWHGAEFIADDKHAWLPQQKNITASCANIVIEIEHAPAPTIAPLAVHADGCEIAAAEWQQLAALAAKTWVPASTESRAKGAGAGVLDND